MVTSQQVQIDGFVRQEWPRIKQELIRTHGFRVLKDPVFVEAGMILYWQNTLAVIGATEDGERLTEDRWSEVTLPAHNSSVVAHYLRKGLLFAPPDEISVEEVEPQIEGMDPNLSVSIGGPERRFVCQHGMDRYAFSTWDGYLNHVNSRREPVNADLIPKDVLERLGEYPYFCIQHNLGFKSKEIAERHRREALRTPGRPQHVTVDQMRREEPVEPEPVPVVQTEPEPSVQVVPDHQHVYESDKRGAPCVKVGCDAVRKARPKGSKRQRRTKE